MLLNSAYVFACSCKTLQHSRQQLFRTLVIVSKLFTRLHESLTVFVQRVVSQVHVKILDVSRVRLFVVVSGESAKTFRAQIRFNRIYSSDHDVDSKVELLLFVKNGIFNVPLRQKLMVKRYFRKVTELFEQDNSITSSSLGRLCNKSLLRILPHMMLKVSDLVWKQKWVRHEFEVYGEEPLQSAYDDAENILLRKVVHKRVSVKRAFSHFYDVKVVVSQRHSIPKNRSISRLVCLSVSVLANDILDGVKLSPTMISIDYNLSSSHLILFVTVHHAIMILWFDHRHIHFFYLRWCLSWILERLSLWRLNMRNDWIACSSKLLRLNKRWNLFTVILLAWKVWDLAVHLLWWQLCALSLNWRSTYLIRWWVWSHCLNLCFYRNTAFLFAVLRSLILVETALQWVLLLNLSEVLILV